MDLMSLPGSWLFLLLILLVVAGLLFLAVKFNISLGNLPGDFVYKRGNLTCVIPLVSSLLISVVITIILNILLSWIKK